MSNNRYPLQGGSFSTYLLGVGVLGFLHNFIGMAIQERVKVE